MLEATYSDSLILPSFDTIYFLRKPMTAFIYFKFCQTKYVRLSNWQTFYIFQLILLWCRQTRKIYYRIVTDRSIFSLLRHLLGGRFFWKINSLFSFGANQSLHSSCWESIDPSLVSKVIGHLPFLSGFRWDNLLIFTRLIKFNWILTSIANSMCW